MDCKATVTLGEFSRGGQTRGPNQALDHDFGSVGKSIPCGILDEDSGQLYLHFGCSYKTSDFIVDNLQAWWNGLPVSVQVEMQLRVYRIEYANAVERTNINSSATNTY
jgi:hypothetical protein